MIPFKKGLYYIPAITCFCTSAASLHIVVVLRVARSVIGIGSLDTVIESNVSVWREWHPHFPSPCHLAISLIFSEFAVLEGRGEWDKREWEMERDKRTSSASPIFK